MKKRIVVLCAVMVTAMLSLGMITSLGAEKNENLVISQAESLQIANNDSNDIVTEEELIAEATQINSDLVAQYSAVTKDNIYHKMINSIDFYNTASGTIDLKLVGVPTVVDYSVDMIKCNSYQKIVNTDMNLEKFCENGVTYSYDNLARTSQALIDAVSKVELLQISNELSSNLQTYANDDARVTLGSDGYYTYYYRANPTNAAFASVSLFPQELAFGFLRDKSLWNITDQIIYENRNCAVITGSAAPSYGEKLGVATFMMYVDTETGILLKYEGYNDSGSIVDYIDTSDFSLQSNDTLLTKPLKKYETYTSLNDREELEFINSFISQN